MRYLVCTVDADPCPVGNVASLPFLETVDFTSLGITPETLLYVFGWGFAAVFGFWLIGFGTALAIAHIRKV
ncbi:hypothetical protein J2W32_001175 [Variovorax boronicumulans]|uniref:Uncharacterized protein n=1 Tax=Variovorax boronicumulans TaxID=436515 RepID=A0AAW8CWW8_9BURK|nr:hypothetical protein [Variovorax boronicumulans]MDP9892381.1 hypothetical protein [Variovorax boronicumulans]MDQ0052139.1 hypothetical protein [Variovorax boronicumulans]